MPRARRKSCNGNELNDAPVNAHHSSECRNCGKFPNEPAEILATIVICDRSNGLDAAGHSLIVSTVTMRLFLLDRLTVTRP